MSEKLTDDAVVARALEAVSLRKGALGEVFLRRSISASIEVKDGAIENVLDHGERGIGVRVIDAERAGFATTSDLSRDGIDACVKAAHAMARVTEADPDLVVAWTGELPSPALALYEPGATERPVAERAEVAFAAERAARAVDPRIATFRKTTFSDGESTTIFATTTGARGTYRESTYVVGTSAVAQDGEERQIGGHVEAARTFAGIDPGAVGRRAAELAVGKLGSRPFETQTLAVVLDPWMATQLLGAIGALFNADSVLKGKSLFKDRVDERVASPKVTIIDDARRIGGMRSAPFDGEGTPTTTRALLEGGVLRGYLTSLKTARKLKVEPTGNARRTSYSAPSRIGASNLHIAAGPDDPPGLVAGLERALKVTALLNLHTIDPISGEFSLGAAGDYLERGEKRYPVQGITIAGNLLALLSSVSGVGSDLTFGASGMGSPTLVIQDLSVGGT